MTDNDRQAEAWVAEVGRALETVRTRRPLVHCLTNAVTINDVANSLLALGGRPVMAAWLDEIPAITSQADALYLNLGTPDSQRLEAIRLAAQVAYRSAIPIVLDPVGVGSSLARLALAQTLIADTPPTVVRGNKAEIRALLAAPAPASGPGAHFPQSGVDALEADASTADGDEAGRLAAALARQTMVGAAALSGPRDWIAARLAAELLAVDNGHPWLGRISGAGCVVTALIAAFAAVSCPPQVAALAGLLVYGIAAERAAAQASGPGTFRPLLLDALYTIQPDDLARSAQVVIIKR